MKNLAFLLKNKNKNYMNIMPHLLVHNFYTYFLHDKYIKLSDHKVQVLKKCWILKQ